MLSIKKDSVSNTCWRDSGGTWNPKLTPNCHRPIRLLKAECSGLFPATEVPEHQLVRSYHSRKNQAEHLLGVVLSLNLTPQNQHFFYFSAV